MPLTLCPGNWPPSPGLAPCAILICNTSALIRYSGVTPNRPEATCLILERRSLPWRSGSSPPSPELERAPSRSEEHTSELQSLMRISYAVFCLKKKNKTIHQTIYHNSKSLV